MVEFAASATLLFTIMFSVMEFSRALYVDHFVSNAATEAARYASLRGSTYTGACASYTAFSCAATSGNITTFVQKIAPAGVNISSPTLSVTTTWPSKTPSGAYCRAATGANSPGCTVQVKVSYAFAFLLPFMPKTPLTLTSTSAYAISQ